MIIRVTVEGMELKVFSDLEEVVSSPVREAGRALARLAAGEATLRLERWSDASAEVRAALQSLLLEDVRPDPAVLITRCLSLFSLHTALSPPSASERSRRRSMITVAARQQTIEQDMRETNTPRLFGFIIKKIHSYKNIYVIK
jgi:hypothetical protein